MQSMLRPVVLTLAITAVGMSCDRAHAAGFSNCAALRNEKAYGRKYEDFAYILPGKDGYLFRTKQDLRSEFKISDSVVKPYRDFAAALRRHNIELVIAYTPLRGMVMADQAPAGDALAPGYQPAVAGKNYLKFIDALNEAGVVTVGGTQFNLAAPYFYKADHHWTSAGAEAMAGLLATRIKQLPFYGTLPKQEFVTTPLRDATFAGTFNKVLHALCQQNAPDETDHLTQTVAKTSSSNNAADALFGDTSLPAVTLIGTSNSKKESNNVNFDGFLKQKLSVDILNKAISGGGMDEPLLAYLASDQFRQAPPKLIIWEIPGYYDLKGTKSRNVIAQAIALAEGDCGDKNILSANMPVTGDTQTLFDITAKQPTNGANAYLFLKFSQPTRKDVNVTFDYADGSNEAFKFKRSKLYPYDGVYAYNPRKNKPLQRVELSAKDDTTDLSVSARLCALPVQTAPPTPVKAKRSWWNILRDRWHR